MEVWTLFMYVHYTPVTLFHPVIHLYFDDDVFPESVLPSNFTKVIKTFRLRTCSINLIVS